MLVKRVTVGELAENQLNRSLRMERTVKENVPFLEISPQCLRIY